MMISSERAAAIQSGFSRQRILVVGDLMLDRFIRGTVDRISPEAPVPVVKVSHEKDMPGGAANVAMNVRSLGGDAVIAGLVGRDDSGRRLMRVLRSGRIGTDGIMALPSFRTTVKTRIVADRQQVVRVDWEDVREFPGGTVERFCRRLETLIGRMTGVIIEDYAKGAIAQEVVDTVLACARKRGIPVGFDPNRNRVLQMSGITVATPNTREAYAAAGLPENTPLVDPRKDLQLRKAAEILLRKWNPQQLIITLGSHGMYLAAKGHAPRIIPTRAREVFDVSGAGDTVIAACVLALSAGAGDLEAAEIGNFAAGVVVGKLGTATCSPKELVAAVRDEERLSA